jgi:D-alanyl-D-alanine carboxypeptidase (penicillin-binding protein 5/6)
MDEPAFARIVAMPAATIPVAGKITNYNSLVGTGGVVGVKTGSSNAAGGCLVFAVRSAAGPLVFGAILAQHDGPFLPTVLSRGRALAAAAARVPSQFEIGGRRVATLRTAWGTSSAVSARDALRVVGWPGLVARVTVTRRFATATLGAQRVRVAVDAPPPRGPSLWWRLFRGV